MSEPSQDPEAARRDRLRRARRAAGHTQEVFGTLTGVGAQTVRRWESGHQDPRPGRIPRIARVLSLSIPAAAALFEMDPAHVPDPLHTALEIRAEVEALRAAYGEQPSSALLLEAVTLLSRLDAVRPAAGGTRTVREVDTADAEASLLLAQLTWDATGRRDRAPAAPLLARARNAARRSGDALALSFGLLRSAHLELSTGDAETAVRHAEKAARVAEPVSPALAALALLHAAEAHATAGRAADAERTLAASGAMADAAPADDPGLPLCPPPAGPWMTGSCYLRLGRHAEARDAFLAAARAAGSDGCRAMALGKVSMAHLGTGELERSVAALREAVGLLDEASGAGAVGAVAVVAGAAAAMLRRCPADGSVAEVAGRVLELVCGQAAGGLITEAGGSHRSP